MVKAIIHTIDDDDNFGNRLQNFALHNILSSRYGYEVKTTQRFEGSRNYYSIVNDFRTKWPLSIVLAVLKGRRSNIQTELMQLSRNAVFRKFTKQYVPKVKEKVVNTNYGLYVIGSDQIWNPEFRRDLASDFLPGVAKEKKIAFAASMGVQPTVLTENEMDIIREGVTNLQSVSTRELDLANHLSGIAGDSIQCVLDPTMLVNKDVWHNLAIESSFKPKGKFILTYFLGDVSFDVRRIIQEKSDDLQTAIININDSTKPYFGKVGPLEFLYLFENAEMVYTDSYHAIVFSIINNKQFEVFNRKSADIKHTMNSRMTTLFNHFELDSRIRNVNDGQTSLPSLNYVDINRILEQKKQESLNWLDHAVAEI